MGRAFSEVITRDLATAPGIYAIPSDRLHSLDPAFGSRPIAAPGISAEQSLALAAGATRLGYGRYWWRGGQLEARLTLEDPASTTVQEWSAAANDVLNAANALARQVSNRAVPYVTRSSAAIKSYVLALESAELGPMMGRLEESIAADPNYPPPYSRLAQAMLQEQDRTGAMALLQRALSHAAAMPELEHVRLEFEAASLAGQHADAQRALTAWARLTPNDPAVWQSMAQTDMNRHRYEEAKRAYQAALAASPDDANLLNQLGYAAAYADDVETATAALQRYRTIRPADANPYDSLGDVYFLLDRPHDAEAAYLAAAKKDTAFLNGGDFFKAAVARLMTADVKGADALEKQFAEYHAAARDPLLEFYQANWAWVSGRRKAALDSMTRFAQGAEAGPLREAASEAYSQVALWDVALGDRNSAAQMAEHAERLAGPASAGLARAARFLAQPSASPDEWQERADRFYPGPPEQQARELSLSYALLADKHYQQALPLLEDLYENTPPTADDILPLLLGWAELETGKQRDAAALLRFNPIPPPSGVMRLAEFYFPRVFYLRARIARLTGRPAEARQQNGFFLLLSGDQPLIWGEEAMAR